MRAAQGSLLWHHAAAGPAQAQQAAGRLPRAPGCATKGSVAAFAPLPVRRYTADLKRPLEQSVEEKRAAVDELIQVGWPSSPPQRTVMHRAGATAAAQSHPAPTLDRPPQLPTLLLLTRAAPRRRCWRWSAAGT